MPNAFEKAHDVKELDTRAAARGVWLVKVPKYLSEKWQNSGDNNEVGKLRISKPKVPGGKPEVVFCLDDALMSKAAKEKDEVPKEHKFVLTNISGQSLSVLTQNPLPDEEQPGSTREERILFDKVSIEGRVIKRAECRPVANDKTYVQLKRRHLEQTNKPKREVIQLEKVVNTYKPISAHNFTIQEQQKKKEEGKRVRLDQNVVQEMLFSAFEKHQYYNIKDLVRITGQPITYLKEILKEMCTYNTKAPHKNMWELKAEYRHYKET